MKSINEKSVYVNTHVFEMLKELLNIRGKLLLSVRFVQDEQEKPTCFSELDYSLPVYFVHFTVPQEKKKVLVTVKTEWCQGDNNYPNHLKFAYFK